MTRGLSVGFFYALRAAERPDTLTPYSPQESGGGVGNKATLT